MVCFVNEDLEVDVRVLSVGEDECGNDFGDWMMGVLLKVGRSLIRSMEFASPPVARLTDTSSMYTTVENSSQVMLSKSNDPGVSHSSSGRIELQRWQGSNVKSESCLQIHRDGLQSLLEVGLDDLLGRF